MQPCSHPADRLTALFRARDYISGQEFVIARCPGCGWAVTTPQPAADQLTAHYPPGYYGAAGQRRFPQPVEFAQAQLYARRVRWIESASRGARGRVLDVGCGRGLLLRAFQERGWSVQGTELSDPAAAYARTVLGIPVKTGSLEEIQFPEAHFDAVTMWQVLEHVPDPRGVLTEVRRVLKPGGVLMVGVPNFGGWEARVCRDKWFHLDVPRHLTHFTKATLTRALLDAGFLAQRWSGFALEYDCFSFVQSGLNRFGLRQNLLYNLLRGRTAKVIGGESVPLWQVVATALFTVPLGLLSLPATTLAALAGQAGTMTVLASKSGSSQP